jgi:GT2 family glycosyltransferase
VPRPTGLVLLDYDQAAITQRCLRSVAAGTRRPEQIALVENGSHPVDLSEGELAGLGVQVLSPRSNVGAAAGRNLGIDHLIRNTEVERLVLLDNDTIVPADFFALAAETELAPLEIAAPLVFDKGSGEVIYAGGRYDRHHVPHVIDEWPEGESGRRAVDWAPTAALVFDRETWLRVGDFDAWFEFLWEDVEWCYRALSLGAQVRVVPQLRIVHDPHQSSGGPFSAGRVGQWARNGTVFLFDRARVGWGSRLSWIATELGRVVRELRAGWRATAIGRLRGLGAGLREVGRRRFRRAAP